MYPCIEAIEWNNGQAHRLEYHQRRIDAAFRCLYPGTKAFNLEEELEKQQCISASEILKASQVPFFPDQGKYKLRIQYDYQLRSVEFQQYHLREIKTLQMVEISQKTMEYKSSSRELIDAAFARRGTADDVLLVRDGLITDTSYANVAVYDGQKWLSPRIPLLYGTRRAFLLDHQLIEVADISVDELSGFQSLRLFNALIEFGEVELPVSAINY